MDLFETITARRSVRAFQPTPVDPELLNRLLAAIRQAPSAGNLQAYQIHVVRDQPTKDSLANAALGQRFMAQAPLVLVFCADRLRSARQYRQRGEQLYCVQDATVAVAYAQLAATALGLGTCWIGAFDEDQVGRILALPHGLRPVAMLPVGHPADQPSPTPRRPVSDWVIDRP